MSDDDRKKECHHDETIRITKFNREIIEYQKSKIERFVLDALALNEEDKDNQLNIFKVYNLIFQDMI